MFIWPFYLLNDHLADFWILVTWRIGSGRNNRIPGSGSKIPEGLDPDSVKIKQDSKIRHLVTFLYFLNSVDPLVSSTERNFDIEILAGFNPHVHGGALYAPLPFL